MKQQDGRDEDPSAIERKLVLIRKVVQALRANLKEDDCICYPQEISRK